MWLFENRTEKTKKMKPIMSVYRDMLRQATIFRQKSKKASKTSYGISVSEHYDEIAQELYFWVAELELTKEINPPKE
jgi:hypothetical protein